MDRKGRSFVLEAKDGTLLARCIQHEFDHLDGILFVDHAINRFDAEEELDKNDLPALEVDKMLEEPELTAEIEKLLENIEVEEGSDEE
jgi:peptide deformylase